MPRAALAAALLLTLAACRSSAPYTLPAAILNTTLAVGAAGVSRANGGCVATCTHGTTCNPRTGFCEAAPPPPPPQCRVEPGGLRCLPLGVPAVEQPQAGKEPPPTVPFGVSPATGSTPPPPAEASPPGR
ncbi:MAG TPA: hypothetical protein VFP50_13730 [Anaeromyxobacteraceae bacterium]|nr:hypothetical protein [Anaeromyxobacteraceae bacterium]